jgi:hypothetical protein
LISQIGDIVSGLRYPLIFGISAKPLKSRLLDIFDMHNKPLIIDINSQNQGSTGNDNVMSKLINSAKTQMQQSF